METGRRPFDVRLALLFLVVEFALIWLGNKIGTALENTPVSRAAAHALNLATQNILPRPTDSRVVVVDLDGFKRVPADLQFDDGVLPTSRVELQRLIDAVKAYRPLAIGIDIDFSLERLTGEPPTYEYTLDGRIDPAESDPVFFDTLLESRESKDGPPVFLGVHRQAEADPSVWFCKTPREDLGTLGATMPVFADSTDELPVLHRSEHQREWVPTLSFALAQSVRHDFPEHPSWLPRPLYGAVESRIATGDPQELAFQSVIVDYGSLHAVKTVHWTDVLPPQGRPDVSKLGSLEGKVVILGIVDTKAVKPVEVFSVPVAPWKVTGTMVHAAAVDTLLGRGFWVLTAQAKLVLELSAFGLLALLVCLTEFRTSWLAAKGRLADHHAAERRVLRLNIALNIIATILLLLVFTLGVPFARVLWLDLVVTLVLHWTFVLFLIRMRKHGSSSSHPEDAAMA